MNPNTNPRVPFTADDLRKLADPDKKFGGSRDGVATPMFKELVVDDIFEKIKLQVADLNDDGWINGPDIDALFAAIANPQNVDFAKFDIDGDGQLTLINGPTTIDTDVEKFVVLVLATYFGDANLDGLFGTGDLATVFTVGEYEDGENNNSGWVDGDCLRHRRR